MNKIELLLLEDNSDDAKELATLLKNNNYLVSIAKHTDEANKLLEKKSFDMIILDIMINGKPDGISFAQTLNEKELDIPFLFLTSMRSKTIFKEAKYAKPFNYLLKPYNELEVLYALELAIESHYKQSQTISLDNSNAVISPDFIFIKKKNKVEKVDVASINHISVEEKYCSLICKDKNYLIKLSLKKIKGILSNSNFKQVHRNYIINIKKIKEIYFEDNLIIMEDNFTITFSERYKASFIKNNIVFR